MGSERRQRVEKAQSDQQREKKLDILQGELLIRTGDGEVEAFVVVVLVGVAVAAVGAAGLVVTISSADG